MEVLVPNRAFRLLEQNEDNSGSTDGKITFMNGVIYTINKEEKCSQIQLFVSESEFDRSISTIVKGAETVRTVIFPNTTKTVLAGAFENKECLSSAVLNEGLERIEGGSNNEQHGGAFCGTGV